MHLACMMPPALHASCCILEQSMPLLRLLIHPMGPPTSCGALMFQP